MKKLKHVILLVALLGAFVSYAQPSKVETVRMILEDTDPSAVKDIRECKRLIDDAKEHPKTSNSPKMWVYRAAVYFEIARKVDDLNKETPDAIKIAAESLFKCSETDVKSQWKEQFDFYLLNVANVLFNAAVSEYQSAKYDKALEYYQLTSKLIPLDTKGDLKTININEDLVLQYSYYAAMAKGDTKLTKEYITKLIDHNFNDPKIFSALAKVYLDELDTTSALNILDKGRTKFADDKDLLFMKIDIFIKQGNTGKLFDELKVAIGIDDQNEILYFARATTYEKIGKLDSAEMDYKKALEIKPDYYDANFNLGVLQVNKARPVIEQLQKTYKKVEQDALDLKIKKFYSDALIYFEKCWEIGVPNGDKKESYDLVENMQRLYKNVGNESKEAEMKELKETILTK
jgi:tetratricopeptide (TPR) repeat protein